MKYLLFPATPIIAIALSLSACSQRVHTPSAEDRAEALNRDKMNAAALLDSGQFQGAVDELEVLAVTASGDRQVFVMLGDAHAGLDEFERAVEAYESALRLAYTDHEAHLKLATLLMRNQRVGRALTEFELAIKYGDRHPLTHYNYGLALREMDRPEEALEQWRRAHEMDPGDPRFAEAVGIGLTGIDDEEAAIHFEKASHLGADSPSYHNNYGLVLQRLGRFDEAGEHFRSAVAAAADVEEYRFNLAALYMRSGDFEKAVGEWNALIELWGQRWSYSVYLARAQLSLERYADAVDALAGVDLEAGGSARDRVPPERREAFEILALAHRGIGDGPGALEYMRGAVELAPDNIEYRNTYGVLLAENGKIAQAREQWRKVLESDADNAAARENLSQFRP